MIDADDARLAELVAEMQIILDRRNNSAPAAPCAPPDRWIATKEAMRITGVDSCSTVYRWADEFFMVDHKREGGRRFFSENDIRSIEALRAKGRLRRARGE